MILPIIWSEQGFVYLTSIVDLYSRKILAWELTDSLSVEGVVACVNKAKHMRRSDKHVLLHQIEVFNTHRMITLGR